MVSDSRGIFFCIKKKNFGETTTKKDASTHFYRPTYNHIVQNLEFSLNKKSQNVFFSKKQKTLGTP